MEEKNERRRKDVNDLQLCYRFVSLLLAIVCFLSLSLACVLYLRTDVYYSEGGREFLALFDYGTYEGKINNKCNATNIFMRHLDECLCDVPKVITDDFFERGGKIDVVLNIEDIVTVSEDQKKYGTMAGCYVIPVKQIYMKYVYSQADSIVHEMGHFVDRTYKISDGTFTDIYVLEAKNFKEHISGTDYSISSKLEYFAESFKECIYHPDKMKKYCPLTYGYIMLSLNEIYGI